MSELSQEEAFYPVDNFKQKPVKKSLKNYMVIRRRRLARLTAGENTSPSSSVSPPITPISQSPIINRTQSPMTFESQGTPVEEKNFSDLNKPQTDNHEMKVGSFEEKKCEGTFKEPSKPIDINMPSSSKAPPQRSDSETSSIHMEVDETSGCADKFAGNTDIDSGFENMEVDEPDTQKKDIQRQRTTSSSTEMTEEQLQSAIARVLHSTFKQPSETRLFLPETTEQLKRDPNMTMRDLTSYAIMEILALIAKGNDPFKNLKQTNPDICDTASVGSFPVAPRRRLALAQSRRGLSHPSFNHEEYRGESADASCTCG
ncbi:hypothetical protein NQ317_000381 [Molorchus minor]|uniref:Uncharacterized protein n=1 Tax=Molorchus minor TaxID=1323400 RepID=A0ABQ9J9U1_9CUCU|nr:hypothetical protein NQ317_000381 [Molorchus minor]